MSFKNFKMRDRAEQNTHARARTHVSCVTASWRKHHDWTLDDKQQHTFSTFSSFNLMRLRRTRALGVHWRGEQSKLPERVSKNVKYLRVLELHRCRSLQDRGRDDERENVRGRCHDEDVQPAAVGQTHGRKRRAQKVPHWGGGGQLL